MADQVIELAGVGEISLDNPRVAQFHAWLEGWRGSSTGPFLGQAPPGTETLFESLFIAVQTGLDSLGELVGFPVAMIAQGLPPIVDALSSIASSVPAVAEAVAIIVAASDVLLGAGMPLPPETVGSLNTLRVVFSRLPAARQAELLRGSEQDLLQKAAQTNQQGDVEQLLATQKSKVQRREQAAILETAAGIGVPVVAGGALTIALAGSVGTGGALTIGSVTTALGLGLSAILGAFD